MSLQIGVIVSTTRPTRAGRKVADWFMDQVADSDMEFEILDLKEWDLPFLSEPESASSGNYAQELSKKWSAKVASLDGFVFVTAEYNNGMPAPLKNAIDTLYHEWAKKPVAFLGYGAYGATRSVEQVAAVMAKVNAMPLLSTFVGILNPWESVTDEGVKPEFVRGSVDGVLKNLEWWAETLKQARE